MTKSHYPHIKAGPRRQVFLTPGVVILSFNHTAAALFLWLVNTMPDYDDEGFRFLKIPHTLMLTVISEWPEPLWILTSLRIVQTLETLETARMKPKFAPTLSGRIVGFAFKLMRTAWRSVLWYYFMETSVVHIFKVVFFHLLKNFTLQIFIFFYRL